MFDFRRVAIAAAACSLLPGAASAQNLSAAYRAALDRDPEWRGARDDADALSEGDAQARALFRPTIGATAGVGYGRTTASVTLPPPVEDIDRLRLAGTTLDAAITVQQPIINGQSRAQARELRAGAKAGAAQLDGARQQLMLRVVEAYFAVLSARDELQSTSAQEASARREQRAAQARFDAGRAKITDVREAQARADSAAAQKIDASAKVDVAVARFGELTGLEGSAVLPVRGDLVALAPQGTLAAWQTRGEAASPAVVARTFAADAAAARVGEFTWGSRVRVDATGSASELRFPGGDNGFASIDRIRGYTAALRLQVPLYTGGGLESQRRQAAAQARSAREQLDAARRDVRLKVQQAWSGQSSSVAGIAALRTALDSAQLQEKAAVTGREVGVRTQSDVLSAQALVIETQRRLGDAIRAYERSRLSLFAAAGELDEKRLQEIDRDLAGS